MILICKMVTGVSQGKYHSKGAEDVFKHVRRSVRKGTENDKLSLDHASRPFGDPVDLFVHKNHPNGDAN